MRWLMFVVLAGCGSNQGLSVWVHPRQGELRPTVWYVETQIENSTVGPLVRAQYVCGDEPIRFQAARGCGLGPDTLSGAVWRLYDTSVCGTEATFMSEGARSQGAEFVGNIPEHTLLNDEAEIRACEDGLLSYHVALPAVTGPLANLR